VRDVIALKFGMERGRVGSESLTRVKDGRQHFIIDIDEAEGLFSNFSCFGGHSSDAVSHKAHDAIQAILLTWTGFGPGLPGSSIRNTRHVFVGQNGMDARKGASF